MFSQPLASGQEVLSLSEAVQVHENQSRKSETASQPELTEVPDFVKPLFDFVIANGEEVRAWNWMGGQAASLRGSIYSHPRAQGYLSPEDIPLIMADIQQGLAQQTPETEDEITEEESSEEKNPSAEVGAEDEKEVEASTEQEASKEKGKPEKLQESRKSEAQDEKKVESEKAEVVEAAKNEEQVTRPVSPTVNMDKPAATESGNRVQVEATYTTAPRSEPQTITASSADRSAGEVVRIDSVPAEVSPAADREARQVSANDPAEETAPVQDAVAPEISDIETEEVTLVEEQPMAELRHEPLVVDIAPESATSEGLEAIDELIETDEKEDEVSAEAPFENIVQLTEDNLQAESLVEIAEIDLEQALVSQEEDVMFSDSAESLLLAEDEVLIIDHSGEGLYTIQENGEYYGEIEFDEELATLEPALLQYDELPIFDNPELVISGQTMETCLGIESAEKAVGELFEMIEKEPEAGELVTEVVTKIVEVCFEFEDEVDDVVLEENMAQLEELFVEFFEKAGIDYSAESVESLTKLVVTAPMLQAIKQLKNEEAQTDVPNDGTNEAIAQILIGISNMKRAMEHASAIGRSALRLYRSRPILESLAFSLS